MRSFLLFLFLVFVLCGAAHAQQGGAYEIQVYGSETVAPGTTMFEIHSNFTGEGQRRVIEGVYPTYHAEHETLEITQGINDWSEVGFYVFTDEQDHHGVQWVGDHIRPRVRVPAKWGWPVGLSLSTEIGYQRPPFSPDTWTWEIRPIIDKTKGRFYWAINPALERAWHGPDVNLGLDFSPDVKLSWDFTKVITGGVEYYSDYGSLHGLYPLRQQQQQFFPAIDLNVSPNWEINFGVGIGATAATDHLVFKFILGRHFSWGKTPPAPEPGPPGPSAYWKTPGQTETRP